jgi:DtxR family transcriptional regulator, Mn-dependent transcriptional regulator
MPEVRIDECCAHRPSAAVEDLLRTVFVLSGRGEPAATSALAAELRVTAPTVSGTLKRLAAQGLVERTEDHHAVLTEHGVAHARDVVRRHRLLETFLVEVVGLAWDEVHVEADVLEHAVSDVVVERIDDLLGRPERDPHGDPIPPARDGRGEHDERWGIRLDTAPAGSALVVERIYDRDGPALRYLAELGVRPGTRIEVVGRGPLGGPLWVRLGGSEHALGDRLGRVVYGRVAS